MTKKTGVRILFYEEKPINNTYYVAYTLIQVTIGVRTFWIYSEETRDYSHEILKSDDKLMSSRDVNQAEAIRYACNASAQAYAALMKEND